MATSFMRFPTTFQQQQPPGMLDPRTGMMAGRPGAMPVSQQQMGYAPQNPFMSPMGGDTNAASTLFSAPPANYGYGAPTTSAPAGTTPDMALAGNAGNFFNPLQQMAAGQGAGAAINTTPQWQAMIDAMQRPMQEQQANLAEQLNVGGGRFSTGYGTAMTDLLTQQGLQQQSLLAQMQVPALMQAQNIQAGAGTTLGGFGQQALSQLSGQDFQSQMQQYQNALASAQQLAGMGGTAAGQLAGQGVAGGNALLGGMLTGTQGLFGAENTAGLNASQQILQALGLGGQLGGQQYGLQQQQLSNLYQQWMSQQPWANPMLPYLMGAATGIPSLAYPQYQPGMFGQVMQGAGSIIGGIGQLGGSAGLGGLLGLSDIRVKDVRKVIDTELGKELGLDAYRFSYLWEPNVERVGFKAHEVEEKYPWAVGDISGLKFVDYGKLAMEAMLTA